MSFLKKKDKESPKETSREGVHSTIHLAGKDCAMIFREEGKIEMAMKPRQQGQPLDLSYGEMLLAMFATLIHNKEWVEKTVEEFNNNKFGGNF